MLKETTKKERIYKIRMQMTMMSIVLLIVIFMAVIALRCEDVYASEMQEVTSPIIVEPVKEIVPLSMVKTIEEVKQIPYEPMFEPGVFSHTFKDQASGRTLSYWIIIPEHNSAGMPLVVYLHGDSYLYNFEGLPYSPLPGNAKMKYGEDIPCIFLIPHMQQGTWGDMGNCQAVKNLIGLVSCQYCTDMSRIALTGFGSGAIGCWKMADEYQSFFSAIAPISCRPGDVNCANFSIVPIWAFIGDGEDDWGYYGEELKAMVDGINKMGGHAELTVIEDMKHGGVEPYVYGGSLLEWLINPRFFAV